jgi:hypothetical protein
VGKPEGKILLGKPRRRWVDNIEMVLREIGWGGLVWIGFDLSGSGYEPIDGSCEYSNEPSNSIKCWEVLE